MGDRWHRELKKTRCRPQSNDGMFDVQFDLSPLKEVIQRVRSMAGDDFLCREIEHNIMPNVLLTLRNKIRENLLSKQSGKATGLLHDALAYKIVPYQNGRVVVGMVGVDRNACAEVDRVSRANKAAEFHEKGKRGRYKKGDLKRAERRIGETYRVKIRPAKYFHLVEFGHALKKEKGGEPIGDVAGPMALSMQVVDF